MSALRFPATLRGRLTAWSTVVVLAALIVYTGAMYLSLRQVLWAELDERLHNDIESLEGLLQPYWTPDGVREPSGHPVLDADDYRWFEVWSIDGRRLFASDRANVRPVTGLTDPPARRTLSLDQGDGVSIRVKEEPGHIAGHAVVIRTMATEGPLRQEINELGRLVALAAPVVIGLAAFGGYRLVRRTLRPVDELVAAAHAVTAERLHTRVPVTSPSDEVGQISTAFNDMLATLETSFEQMRRFTANASHELRTPLTALRATGQAALSGGSSVGDYRDAVGDMIEDADQLTRVLDAMLLLAQADAGALPIERRWIDLDQVISDVARECEVLGQERRQGLRLACGAGPAWVDPTIIRIALANLIHNAFRYGPAGRDVTVTAVSDAAHWTVEVRDEGPGIAPEHQAQIFHRFYRVDPGRSQPLGGVGLGLAMARWSVEAHGGTLDVRSELGAGSTFRIMLPRQGSPAES